MIALWLAACKGEPPAAGPVEVTFETCDGDATRTFDAAPTWDDVAPLVAAHCVECHTADGISGIALDTYASARAWAPVMAADVASRTMPPYPGRSCDECRTHERARWLDDDAVATIAAWGRGGAPAGSGPDTPLEPTTPPPHLGDLATDTWILPVAYTPDASVSDDNHCFVLDPGLDADTFLTAVEVLPDQLQEVHHVLVYATETPAGDAAAADLDDGGRGWACDAGPGIDELDLVAAWAPGTGMLAYPVDTGLRLVAGRQIVVQVHYNTANGVTPDRTSIAVLTQDQVPIPGQFVRINAHDELLLPPGAAATEIVHEESIPARARVWGAAGHMHRRGVEMSLTTDLGQCALDIRRWDFDWQLLYFFEEPLETSAGESARLSCTFDTTGDDAEVVWGEGSGDEMCIAFLYVTGT